MNELTDFEKGQIVGARIGGMSVSETAKLCNVSTRTVMKVLSAYNNYGFTPSASKTKPRKKNAGANGKAASAKAVPDSEVEVQNPDEDMDTPESKTQDDE